MSEKFLDDLLRIQADLGALIERVKAFDAANISPLMLKVGTIRRIAIIEEVYRKGKKVVPGDISNFARKYGKSPSSCSGYYSGNKPSLESSSDKIYRMLTPAGEKVVEEYRIKFGQNWLNYVPLDVVGNPKTPDAIEVCLLSE